MAKKGFNQETKKNQISILNALDEGENTFVLTDSLITFYKKKTSLCYWKNLHGNLSPSLKIMVFLNRWQATGDTRHLTRYMWNVTPEILVVKYFIGATIRTHRDILCFPCVGFLKFIHIIVYN